MPIDDLDFDELSDTLQRLEGRRLAVAIVTAGGMVATACGRLARFDQLGQEREDRRGFFFADDAGGFIVDRADFTGARWNGPYNLEIDVDGVQLDVELEEGAEPPS